MKFKKKIFFHFIWNRNTNRYINTNPPAVSNFKCLHWPVSRCDPRNLEGPKYLSHHLLPFMLCVNRKLGRIIGAITWIKYSSMGCKHSSWWLNYSDKCLSRVLASNEFLVQKFNTENWQRFRGMNKSTPNTLCNSAY